MAEDNKKPEAAKPAPLSKARDVSLPAAVLALTVSRDGKTAYAACQDGTVFAVDLDARRAEPLGRHDSYASGVALLPDQQTLLSSGYDGTIHWHDIATRKTLRSIRAHQFWSWDLQTSPDGSHVASVTGQYQAGGYKYEPAAEREPSVKIYNARTGELVREFAHVPPVQAVAFTPDSRHVAAGNLMGEVRIWEIATGRQVSAWTNPDLTSWGVIKSHHYLGGVFAMEFSPAGDELYVCGMGPMHDPMAGNGTQRWQRFAWREGKKLDETHEGESGQGLMEALAFHPTGKIFAMAGRLFQGQWNLAIFETATGKNRHAIDAKHRITSAAFTTDGTRLVLGKAKQQEKKNKEGKWPEYGLIEIYAVSPDLV